MLVRRFDKDRNGLQRVPHPWRDPYADGRWLRQAYTPGRKEVQLSDAELTSRNQELARRLARDRGSKLLAVSSCALSCQPCLCSRPILGVGSC